MKAYTIVDTKTGLTLMYPPGHPLSDVEMGGTVMFESMDDAMKFANAYAREWNEDVTTFVVAEIDLNATERIH